MAGDWSQFNTILNALINIATGVAVAIATFFFVVAAIGYTMSGGNPAAQMKAKSGMTDALVGLGLVFAARIIVGIVSSVIPH
jgi:hypothetical protein